MPKKTDDYKKISVEETIKELKVDREKGLSKEEVEKRLSEYGHNEIPEKEHSPCDAGLTRRLAQVNFLELGAWNLELRCP